MEVSDRIIIAYHAHRRCQIDSTCEIQVIVNLRCPDSSVKEHTYILNLLTLKL